MSDIKIFTDNIDGKALDQIYTLAKQPAFSDCKIRIMPDVHAGAGCVIGFTANLGEKVIPNIVGVDIGCGMLTVNIGNVEIDFKKLDEVIRENIPSGKTVHEEEQKDAHMIDGLFCYNRLKNTDWLLRSLGTLGGGNHFIEVDEADSGDKYLVIHTGSRNVGKQVAEYYQNLAIDNMIGKKRFAQAQKKLVDFYKRNGKEHEIEDAIKELKRSFGIEDKIHKELCYLTGTDRLDYLHDMQICQEFAQSNRSKIADTIICKMGFKEKERFETVHNYIEIETNLIRKGAISAKLGEKLLIPINMRDGCIIGIGKGNEDWNCSAPHGAGRIMSRSKAKESITLEEFEKSMEGIYTTSVNNSTIDESPMVYKTMDEIVKNISDTVEIDSIIRPIYNFKAGE